LIPRLVGREFFPAEIDFFSSGIFSTLNFSECLALQPANATCGLAVHAVMDGKERWS
jgi:hypothetical protein